ncbi:MAG: hypothetical protein EU535_06310 [Promethearchaeota archaeon]|nr:MAG: hypothetical protein EU535_06310 [Candidatus Lokiarchaeota archaeon]
MNNLDQDDLTNKEKILSLLEFNNLTSEEIANELSLSEQDTRTYLLRLKNDNKVKVIDKKGRFYVYACVKESESEKNKRLINELEYDLGFLLNLIETKMRLKSGTELNPTDIYIIKKIRNRISEKEEDINVTSEVLNDYINYEQEIHSSIQERINHLEDKIEKLASKSRDESIEKQLLGFSEVSITRNEMLKKMREILEKARVNAFIIVPNIIDLHYFTLDEVWSSIDLRIACSFNPEFNLQKELLDNFKALDNISEIHFIKQKDRYALLRDQEELLWAIKSEGKDTYLMLHTKDPEQIRLFKDIMGESWLFLEYEKQVRKFIVPRKYLDKIPKKCPHCGGEILSKVITKPSKDIDTTYEIAGICKVCGSVFSPALE